MTLPFGLNIPPKNPTTKGERSPNFRNFGSTQSFARVVVFHYVKQNFESINYTGSAPQNSSIFQIETRIIEQEITSLSVDKQINSPSGNFEFELLPTINWKRFVSPGDWCLIYIHSKPTEPLTVDNIRNRDIAMIGNVDRISRSRRKNEDDDKLETRYMVAGRDFGKIFEDTDLFFNPYVAKMSSEALIRSSLRSRGLPYNGGPSDIVNSILDVFMKDGGSSVAIKKNNQESTAIDQANVPRVLVDLINQDIPPQVQVNQIGALSLSIDEALTRNVVENLPGFKPVGHLDVFSNGSLWKFITENSNSLINESFLELERFGEDGSVRPAIYVRPRPSSPFFGKDETSGFIGALNGAWQDLNKIVKENGAQLNISKDDIIFDNIGKDARTRFNAWWMTPRYSGDSGLNPLANKVAVPGGGPLLPLVDTASISRYGLKRTEGDLDFCYATKKIPLPGNDILQAFLNHFFDQHRFNHLYDTGTIEISGKHLSVGSVLTVSSSSGDPRKLYYIEGYSHSWKFPGKWKTTLKVTRGQYEFDKTDGRPFIDINDDTGTPDKEFEDTSLVKTNVSRSSGGDSSKKEDDGYSIPGFNIDTSGL